MKNKDVVKNAVYFDFIVSIIIAIVGLLCFFINFSDSVLKYICILIYVGCAVVGYVTDLVYKNKKLDVYKGSKIYMIIMAVIAILALNIFKYDKMMVLCGSLFALATSLSILDYFFYYNKQKKDFAKVVGISTAIMLIFSILMLINVFVDFKIGEKAFLINYTDRIAITLVLVGGLKAVVNKLIIKDNNY
ncbi:MAG: hypothetical protein IJ574_05270 [Bacilli bacterium]|nr:hypothetical protein [Bacilli bacterium]